MIFTGWCCFDRFDELMNRHEHLLIMCLQEEGTVGV